jgi:hypothetical protein
MCHEFFTGIPSSVINSYDLGPVTLAMIKGPFQGLNSLWCPLFSVYDEVLGLRLEGFGVVYFCRSGVLILGDSAQTIG